MEVTKDAGRRHGLEGQGMRNRATEKNPSGHIPRYASRVLLLTEALQALPPETQDAAYGAPVLDILATSLERLAAALE